MVAVVLAAVVLVAAALVAVALVAAFLLAVSLLATFLDDDLELADGLAAGAFADEDGGALVVVALTVAFAADAFF